MSTETQEWTEIDDANMEWATKSDVNAVSTKVDALAETFDEQGAKLNDLTETVDKQSAKLNELTEIVGVLATKVDKLASAVDEQSTKFKELTEIVYAQWTRVDSLTTAVDKLAVEAIKTQVTLKWVAWILGGMSALMAALIGALVAIALQL